MDQNLKQLLQDLQKTREQFWNITPEVGKFLQNLIIKNNFKTVLEIGTSNGYSALHLAYALQKTNGTLYTIESNKKIRYPLAQENFKKSGLTNINLILGHAPEAIPKNPKKFDLIFLDATKHEHLQYFQALQNRVTPSGIIITDNYNSHKKDLKTFTEAITKTKNWKTQTSNLGTGLLIAQKIH